MHLATLTILTMHNVFQIKDLVMIHVPKMANIMENDILFPVTVQSCTNHIVVFFIETFVTGLKWDEKHMNKGILS